MTANQPDKLPLTMKIFVAVIVCYCLSFGDSVPAYGATGGSYGHGTIFPSYNNRLNARLIAAQFYYKPSYNLYGKINSI